MTIDKRRERAEDHDGRPTKREAQQPVGRPVICRYRREERDGRPVA